MLSRIRRKIIVTLAIATLGGCSNQQPLSETAYEVVMATYSACNREHAEGLEAATATLEELTASKQISDYEAEQLRSILAIAQQGEWGKASQQARALMEAQVRR